MSTRTFPRVNCLVLKSQDHPFQDQFQAGYVQHCRGSSLPTTLPPLLLQMEHIHGNNSAGVRRVKPRLAKPAHQVSIVSLGAPEAQCVPISTACLLSPWIILHHLSKVPLYYQFSQSTSPGQRQADSEWGRVNPRGIVFVMLFPLCLTEDLSVTHQSKHRYHPSLCLWLAGEFNVVQQCNSCFVSILYIVNQIAYFSPSLVPQLTE